MAETTYSYSISADITAGEVHEGQLADAIAASAIVTACTMINSRADDLDVVMADTLSAGDETILDGLVADHVIAPPQPNFLSASATVEAGTTSTTYVLLDAMAITPEAGKYIVMFSSHGAGTLFKKEMHIAIHKDGTIVPESQRIMGRNTGSQNYDTVRHLYTQAVITVTGSEVIDVRYKTEGGTFSVYERNLILLKVE